MCAKVKEKEEGCPDFEGIYKAIGENDAVSDVRGWVSTGYLPLNKAVSGSYKKGLPLGRIVEIFGASSAGKTLLATKAIASAQAQGGLGIYLDFERSFSMSHAKRVGMSDARGQWIYKRPNHAEEAFGMIDKTLTMLRESGSDKPIVIVVDSVASLITRAQSEMDIEDTRNMKEKLDVPVFLSQTLPKISMMIGDSNACLIFLNQTRANVGVMYGEKEKTTGGNALPFYASVRIQLSKAGKEKEGDEVVAEKVKALIKKNKVWRPFGEVEYITDFSIGIDLVSSHVAQAKKDGLLGDTKGWVVVGEKKMREKELTDMLTTDAKAYEDFLEVMFGE
jgi:protein RecA